MNITYRGFSISTGRPHMPNSFTNINVSGQDTVLATSATDTLTIVAGENVTVTTNAATKTITFVAASGLVTGMEIDYAGTTAPSGWVLKSGGTIGSATSGATERANVDTADLYALMWNNYTNAECAVSTGRGASAAADFAANKTLILPDARGRVSVPAKTGTFATRGANVGAETHTLTEAELPVVAGHTHTTTSYEQSDGQAGGAATYYSTTGSGPANTGSAGGFGSGTAHNNIQPSLITGCRIIKL